MKRLMNMFNRIPIRFVITYLLLLFTAVGLSLYIVKEPEHKIESDILNNNLVTLQQKSSLIEEKLNNVEKVAYQISNDPFINHISSQNAQGDFYLDLNGSKNHLLNYRNKLDDDFVYEYFVYYANRNYVVTPDTCYSTDFFKSYIVKSVNNSEKLAPFFDLISQKQKRGNSQHAFFSYQGTNINCICYVVSIPLMDSSDIENICFLIPTRYFSDIFSQQGASGSSYLQIMNESGEALFTENYGHNNFAASKIDAANINKDSVFNKRINGQDVTVTYATSKANKWKYLWLQQQSVTMSDLYATQRNIALLFVAALIIGIAVALSLAYFNSKPILNIAECLKHAKPEKDIKLDTFQGISDTLNLLIKDNIYFEEKTAQQKPLLENVVAGQLLSGRYESFHTICSHCRYLGFPLDSKIFLVCSVNFLSADSNVTASNNMEKMSMVKTCFKELTNQIVKQHVLYHDTNIMDTTLIIGFELTDEFHQFIKTISKIIRTLSEQYETMIVMGISNPCNSPIELLKSNEEAQEALNYVQFDKKERVVCYSDVRIKEEDYYYPIELEQRLVNAVCLGNVKNLNEIFDIILTENFVKRTPSNHSVKYLYQDLLSTCFQLKNKSPAIPELNEDLKKIADCKILNQNSFERILSTLQSFCAAVNNHKSDRNKIFVQKIIRYLEENYENPNLSLTSVALKFNISSGYLSTFFKEQTGKNFSDNVEFIRINAACELLKESRLTINDICLKVGYNNVKSFRRAFEKIKGISPSVARQEILISST